MNFSDTMKGINDQIAKFSDIGKRRKGDRKGIGQLAFNLSKILSGKRLQCDQRRLDMSKIPKLYPAIVLYDDTIANHAIRLHLHDEMIKWFRKHRIDYSRVGTTLLFTLKDIEYLDALTESMSAEEVMRDYIMFVEQNPTEVQSCFHEFALRHYPDQSRSNRGFALRTADRVLLDLERELIRRSAEQQ